MDFDGWFRMGTFPGRDIAAGSSRKFMSRDARSYLPTYQPLP